MARRLALAFVLALVGLALLALAQLPPGISGWPYHHVPVDGEVVAVEPLHPTGHHGLQSTVRFRYVVDGRAYEDTLGRVWLDGDTPSAHPSVNYEVGAHLTLWIDPAHPKSASRGKDSLLGIDGGQILLGAGLVLAALALVVDALWRRGGRAAG